MRRLLASAFALTLGAAPAVAEPRVRYLVRSETRALATEGAREEVPRPTKPIELRLDAAPTHKISLHPHAQPAQPRMKIRSKYEAPPPPPATRIEFQSHEDAEPSAMNSLGTALSNTLPSSSTRSIIGTPQVIKSADGRLLGFGVTASF